MAPPRQLITSERLLSKIKEVPGPLDTPCWEWQGARLSGKFKYGMIQIGGAKHPQKLYVHRCSYEVFIGPIPVGKSVLHHCDNPPCINPFHLWIGTNGENCTDCAQKLRNTKGSESHFAKLTEDQVAEILRDSRIYEEIGNTYGVSAAMIYLIKAGKNWKHVTRPDIVHKGVYIPSSEEL